MEKKFTQRWVILAVVLATLEIATLWLTRPTWFVISENPSYTLSGTDDTAAIVGTALIAIVLIAVLVMAWRPVSPGRTITLVVLLVFMGAAFLGVNLAAALDLFPSPYR